MNSPWIRYVLWKHKQTKHTFKLNKFGCWTMSANTNKEQIQTRWWTTWNNVSVDFKLYANIKRAINMPSIWQQQQQQKVYSRWWAQKSFVATGRIGHRRLRKIHSVHWVLISHYSSSLRSCCIQSICEFMYLLVFAWFIYVFLFLNCIACFLLLSVNKWVVPGNFWKPSGKNFPSGL